MDTKILDFLSSHRVCALTTLLLGGSPHTAAMHYSHTPDPLTLYFSTENTSRKCQALLSRKPGKASVVIGLSEEEWLTLQMEGDTKILSQSETSNIQELHYAKHPNSAKFKDDPATVFLAFTPTWYRYTDFNTHPPTYVHSA